MAVTVAMKKRFSFGNGYGTICDVTLGSSYPTGGEPITAQQLGITALNFVLPSPAAGYVFEFDHVNKKLKAFTPTTVALAGTAGTADANNTVIKTAGAALGVGGTGTAFTVANSAAEVANGTNLSAVTVRLLAIGL